MKNLYLVAGLAALLSTLAAPAYAQTKDDLAVDFGAAGLWLLPAGGSWSQLDADSPEEMASGDVDGNGQSDLILDFPGQGVWILLNNSQWVQVHTLNAAHIVTADLDGNGRAEVLLDYPSGIWVWRYNAGWTQLHASGARHMAAGDLDGNGRPEVLIDFSGYGVWVWTNNQSWSQLHGRSVRSMAVGDLDGSGRKDVLLDFPGAGIWIWRNNTSWSQLHTFAASHMTAADLDGNGQDEAIIDFPGYGLWVFRNGSAWSQLNTQDPEAVTAGDFDGNGQKDLVIDFGAAGLWPWWNNVSWTKLHSWSPESSVAGKFYRPLPVTFGPGTYRIGVDLPAGRYYVDPAFQYCYWERLSGSGEIIANDFVYDNTGQEIVDIRSTDYAFYADSDCGTWYSTPRHGLQASITSGTWLVGSQVTAGTYMSYVQNGCYWERLRNFDGTLSAIIDNDFVDTAGVRYVQISAGDVGFRTDGECGTWQRVSGSVTSFTASETVDSPVSSPSDIEQNRTMRRRKDGWRD